MDFITASFTHRGGCREHNEDALFENRQAGVWLVADGMGGHRAGDKASELLCETLADHLSRSGGDLDSPGLERALLEGNQRIRRYGQDHLGGQTMGSTVVALLIRHGRYHLFWAGDSRCYRLRQGRIQRLSQDHSQVAEMVAMGLLSEEQAEHHPLSHMVTRAMGVDETVTLDYDSGPVQPGDIFMLCTDGVTREFSDPALESLVKPEQIQEAARAMQHSALVNNCKDNISCIIVRAQNDCYFTGPAGSETSSQEDATIPRPGR